MADPGDRSIAENSLLPALGFLAASAAGAWWTGLAVIEGRPGAMLLRLGLSTLAATYYAVLFRVSRGHPVLPGQR